VLTRNQGECTAGRRRLIPWRATGQERFPCNNFTYYFTLFPKCFSPFDHSTCALSVSGRYLALEGIYLPFRAAFPNYSTRRRGFTKSDARRLTGLSPSMAPRSRGLRRCTTSRIPPCRLQLGPPQGRPDFKSELLPLRSPLLGQSLLVSFPPLIDMLKFSGSSYPIRGQHQAASRYGSLCRGFYG
jgi:hypothetical protein